jgi:hypothetical protein
MVIMAVEDHHGRDGLFFPLNPPLTQIALRLLSAIPRLPHRQAIWIPAYAGMELIFFFAYVPHVSQFWVLFGTESPQSAGGA